MSGLKKVQRQKRYTGNGVVFPAWYVHQVAAAASDAAAAPALRSFAAELQRLTGLGASAPEVEALKGLAAQLRAACAPGAAAEDAAAVPAMVTLLAELAFLENSRLLHRALLGPLGELPAEHLPAVTAVLLRHLEGGKNSGGGASLAGQLPLGQALASLPAERGLWPALAPAAAPALAYLAASITAALAGGESLGQADATAAGGAGGQPQAGHAVHIPPSVVVAVQEATTSMYTLLTAFTPQLQLAEATDAAAAADGASSAVLAAADAMLGVMGTLSVRESLSSASVTLYAAAVLPAPGSSEAPDPALPALHFGEGLVLPALGEGGATLRLSTEEGAGAAELPLGLVDAALRGRGSSLVAELRALPPQTFASAIRGLLAATPLASLTAQLRAHRGAGGPGEPWTLLRDGALPALCDLVMTAPDVQVRFDAINTLALCLERIKACLKQYKAQVTPTPTPSTTAAAAPRGLGTNAGGGSGAARAAPGGPPAATVRQADFVQHPPLLGPELRAAVLAALWACLEDSLSQTSRLAFSCFSTFLEVLDTQEALGALCPGLLGGEGGGVGEGYLEAIARELLAMDSARKGRYSPLASLVQYLGAARLLALQPDLPATSLAALRDNGLCSAVVLFLSALWAAQRAEAPSDEAWRAQWMPVLLGALCGGHESLRSNVCTYLLPVLLRQDPAALGLLLRQLMAQQGDGAAGACVAVLKTGRELALFSQLEDVPVEGLTPDAVEAMMGGAIGHRAEHIRTDALQLVCVHVRLTAPPSAMELRLAARAVTLCLRCTSTHFRMKLVTRLTNLVTRVRTSVAAALNRRGDAAGAASTAEAVARLQAWMQWLTATLVASLYPGAPYERKFIAIDLLGRVLEIFGDQVEGHSGEVPACIKGGSGVLRPGLFHPFHPGFRSEATVNLLVAAAVDSWDRIREGASLALGRMPSPLPGLQSPAALSGLLGWACKLLASARSREADAGARVIAVIMRMYVCNLGWRVSLATGEAAAPAGGPAEAVLFLLDSACDLLERCLDEGERDLVAASRRSLAQGPLLALKCLVPEVAWAELMAQPAAAPGLSSLVARLLALLQRASDFTLPTLSRPQDLNIGAEDVDADDVDLESGDEEEEGAAARDLGPQAQVVTIACWTTMKEVCLLLGVLARALPLQGGERREGGLLSAAQLRAVGDNFVHVLCSLKHNGAVEKGHIGFGVLCEVLLLQREPEFHALPQRWLSALLAHLRRPGQERSDITRRSSGLPFAITSLFRAEPPGSTHRALLQRGMAELLATAADAGTAQPWPRVHALNVARMAFNDSDLAAATAAFFGEGLQVCVAALAAGQWEVRNAATQCYTAMLVRVLGFRNLATKDAATRRALTSAEFFARYPALHPSLLGQLGEAADDLEAGSAALHPSLFPVLALLSRLKPSLKSQLASVRDPLDPGAFVPTVQRCGTAQPMAVRVLAAKALAPLVPANDLPVVAAELAAAVAGAVCGGSVSAAIGGLTLGDGSSGQRPPTDSVHGWLLQLKALLSPDFGAGAAAAPLLAALAPPLARCAALCSPGPDGRWGCAPLSFDFLRTLEALAALPGALEHRPTRALLRDAARRCWAAIEGSAAAASDDGPDPMAGPAYKQATQFYFGTLLPLRREADSSSAEPSSEPSSSDAAALCWAPIGEDLALALASRRYEVRAAALKAACQRLRPRRRQHGDGEQQQGREEEEWEGVRAVVAALLEHEWFHKAQRRALELLDLLPTPAPGTHDASAEVTASLYAAALRFARGAAEPRTRGHALTAVGALIAPRLAASQTDGALEDWAAPAADFLAAVQECVLPWQSPELRLAAVGALQNSGLLLLDPRRQDSAAEAAAGAWEVVLTLMEDEDSDAREAAALAAAAAIEPAGAGAAGSSSGGGGPALSLRQAMVEQVQRAAVGALPGLFGPHPALVSRLCAWVAGGEGPAGSGSSGSGGGGAVDQAQQQQQQPAVAPTSIGRLFDREVDNQHEEALFTAQLAAKALAELGPALQGASGAGALPLVQRWAGAAAAELGALCAGGGWQDSRALWPGGLINHGDLFLRLYRLLLSLWAAAAAAGAAAAWGAEIRAALAALPEGALAAVAAQSELRPVLLAALEAWGQAARADALRGELPPTIGHLFLL